MLNLLPYAKGASFNPEMVCMPNMRRELLEDIWSRILSIDAEKPGTPSVDMNFLNNMNPHLQILHSPRKLFTNMFSP
jgi:hypothetical protein